MTRIFLLLLGGLWIATASAAPFVPAGNGEVLERLPVTTSAPASRELRALRRDLSKQPGNLDLAQRVARRYIELGRSSGDPRYAGYAQAALTPWWQADDAPVEVLVLRASLRQRVHQFDLALRDLDAVLRANPRHVQARLTRATVLTVRGRYAEAMDDCMALQQTSEDLVWGVCLTNVTSLNGKLTQSYPQLRGLLALHPEANPALRSWALGTLAEMAVRAGKAREAEGHFKEALMLDPEDSYLLAAYADFLLDHGRAQEVTDLLDGRARSDGLLLRHALALSEQKSSDLTGEVEQLQARFEASRLRGDAVHQREEARFALWLQRDALRALRLARENWALQKEPADARVLLEAAIAARDQTSITELSAWLSNSRLEDAQLERLLRGRHPG